MKRLFILKGIALWITCVLMIDNIKAQCTFNPTITPSNLILCPNEQDTLWTQVYDTYQWYMNGSVIPGATQQYLVVDYFNSAGSDFSVAATLQGCTELSPSVLVDGWAFLPPFVMHAGDQGWFDGQYLNLCTGDTLLLILMQPYDTNIQWYDNFAPIPGATNDTLMVTTSGSYTAEGAPQLCPSFVQQLGVTIDVLVHQPVIPVITLSNDTLYASPSNATSYQWYMNGFAIPGASNNWHHTTSPGSYTVAIVDTNQCEGASAPFVITSLRDEHASSLIIYPNPFTDHLFIQSAIEPIKEIKVYDITGKMIYHEKFANHLPIQKINFDSVKSQIYFIEVLGEKSVWREKLLH
jgi:hypothetical protein